MLSQFHFFMVLRVKSDIRLVHLFLQYYAGQIGQGLEVHISLYAP